MPHLTRVQLVMALAAILFAVVIPATIGVWQAFSSEPMAQVIAKQLRDRGWDVTIPDWLPFVSLPFGVILFIILGVQLWQQQSAVGTGKGQMSDQEKPQEDRPRIEASGEAVVSYNQSGGITARTVHQRPQPRVLDAEAVRDMIQKLALHTGTTVVITCQMTDEPMAFSQQLESVLRQAGWNVAERNLFGQMAPPVDGVMLRYSGVRPSSMAALREALEGHHVETRERVSDDDRLEILIGPAPW